MTTFTFTAEALTPIHIGAGQEIDPCGFLVKDGRLMRFNPVQILNDLDADARRRFDELVGNADMKGLQGFFREQFIPERHALSWVDASSEFIQEFQRNADNPSNRFLVQMMPRNHLTGQVFLPGSSVKGAIRTAVISHFTNLVPELKNLVHSAVRHAESKNKSKVLEHSALDRMVARKDGGERDEIDRDVFRLIDVEDTMLPSGATIINRAYNWNPHKEGSDRIHMWFERIKSKADGGDLQFQLKLHLDEKAIPYLFERKFIGRTIDLRNLVDACNVFYWRRMEAELEKFFPENNNLTRQAVYRTMAVQDSKGRKVVYPAEFPQMLLRVGRFSHFESLSVDELREGWNAQSGSPIKVMGATRTLCQMGEGKSSLPFGWLMLTLS